MFNKNDGTKAFKPVGRLRVFFALPFYIAVLLIVLNIVLYFIDFPAATVMSVFMVFYIAIYLYMQLALKPGIMHDIIAFFIELFTGAAAAFIWAECAILPVRYQWQSDVAE